MAIWYSTGTISVTAGNPVVAGAGCAWVGTVFPGDALVVPSQQVPPIEVLAVNADGQLTLVRPWPGATASGLAYTIMPTQAHEGRLALDATALIATYRNMLDTTGKGLFGDGSVAAPGMRFVNAQASGLYRYGTSGVGISAAGHVARFDLGQVGVTGNLYLEGASTEDRIIRVGAGRSGNGFSALDLQGDPATPSGLRLIRLNSGVNAESNVEHRGLGDMTIITLNAAGLVFSTNNAPRWRVHATDGHFQPGFDNGYDIGRPALRVRQYYGANTAISSSDGRIKVNAAGTLISETGWQIEAIPDAWLDAWGDVQWGRYRMADAWAEKGDAARWHLGLIAQAVRDAFTSRGIDGTAIGLLCHDSWDEIREPVVERVRETRTQAISITDPVEYETVEVEVPRVTGERLVKAAGDLWSLRYDACQAMEAAWHRRETAALRARIDALEAA